MAFIAAAPNTPLQPGEKRFWVAPEALPEALRTWLQGRSRRSCRAAGAQPSRLEVQWEAPRRGSPLLAGHGVHWLASEDGALSCWSLRGSFGFDACHRWYDSFENSMTSAGLHLLKLENLLVQTFLGGPFHADSNYGRLLDAVREWVASSDAGAPLFVAMYGAICHDWSVILTGCLYVCTSLGYTKSILETPLAQHTLPDSRPPEAVVGLGGPEPAAAASRSVRWSNDQLQRLRSSCSTNFHLATTIMAMTENKAAMTGISAITLPMEELHNKAITMCKTRAGTKEWRCSVARGSVDHVLEMVSALSDHATLLQMGLVSYEHGCESCMFSDDSAGRVASLLVDFLRDMVFCEVVFVRNYAEDLPNCFVGLVDDSLHVRRRVASYAWVVFEEVTKAEALGAEDMWLRDFCRDLVWPCCT